MAQLNQDSMVTVLLCSDLGIRPEIVENDNISLKQWLQGHIPGNNVLYRDKKGRQMDFYSLNAEKKA